MTQSFLSTLELEYGPLDMLQRFFIDADKKAQEVGVTISFGSFNDLVRANAENRPTWLPLLPTYHPDFSEIGKDDFCLLGRDISGRVVAAHAARIFLIRDSCFKDHAESMQIFYGNPSQKVKPGERCTVTAPFASQISGRVYFGGAAWYHPEYRGKGLAGIMPRLSRAIALTQSSVDWVVGIMAEAVVQRGYARRSGYKNIQWDLQLESAFVGKARCAVTWMSNDELIDDLSGVSRASKIDVRVA